MKPEQTAIQPFRVGALLTSQLPSQADKAKQVLTALVKGSREFTPVITEFRRIVSVQPESRLEVIIPPHIAKAIEEGSMQWMEATDGSGFIATTVNGKTGRTTHNARFKVVIPEKETAALANAMAHAQTHAMLRQIIVKLEEMDKKLDLCLANQRAGWIGKIASGIDTFRTVYLEPGKPHSESAFTAGAHQSLKEGLHIGLLQLAEFVNSKKLKPRLTEWKPSRIRGQWLDRIRDDIFWLYAGSEAISAIHSVCDRPIGVREAFNPLRTGLCDLSEKFQSLKLYAAYSDSRESFWKRQLPMFSGEAIAHQNIVLELPANI